ncbi:transketolase [Candidatus Levyibacteriota bacterium]|nr:transketolase [Candidatus Levybacteria bacterium]
MDIDLIKKANLVRKWCLIATTEAQSGHATSSLSAVDLMTVLFDKHYSYDIKNPNNLANDRLIFSKGHAAPLLYSLYAASGAYPFEELKTLRAFGSKFEGHPVATFPYTEAATGSLGQGLSIGAGMAIGIQRCRKLIKKPKVYVLLGDGELAEGQIWEAANFASYYKLNNLIAIADINRFGQSEETMFGHSMDEYINRFSAFGWEVLAIDGHNIEEIENAFNLAVNNKNNRPFIIIAKTIKGKGIDEWENKNGYHSKPLSKEYLEKILKILGELKDEVVFPLRMPKEIMNIKQVDVSIEVETEYKIGDIFMTKEINGKALVKLGKINEQLIVLDGDVKNSTSVQDFEKEFPDRFIECFIAEQNMVGVAVGLSKLGFLPYVATFGAFFTRAFDQIRMGRISEANLKLCGSYAGVSLGKDGSSQMGLEDIAMIGALPDSVILYPADAVATEKLTGLQIGFDGISYLRTARPKVPVIYKDEERFLIGGSKVLQKNKNDLLTVVGGGLTVHEAIKAYEVLRSQNIFIRVIDCYSVKPIDKEALILALKETKKQIIIVVEDHFEHGGLGDFVLSALADQKAIIEKMAISSIAHSGEELEVIRAAGIDSSHIVARVKKLLL